MQQQLLQGAQGQTNKQPVQEGAGRFLHAILSWQGSAVNPEVLEVQKEVGSVPKDSQEVGHGGVSKAEGIAL